MTWELTKYIYNYASLYVTLKVWEATKPDYFSHFLQNYLHYSTSDDCLLKTTIFFLSENQLRSVRPSIAPRQTNSLVL